jgi:hypothetical protein
LTPVVRRDPAVATSTWPVFTGRKGRLLSCEWRIVLWRLRRRRQQSTTTSATISSTKPPIGPTIKPVWTECVDEIDVAVLVFVAGFVAGKLPAPPFAATVPEGEGEVEVLLGRVVIVEMESARFPLVLRPAVSDACPVLFSGAVVVGPGLGEVSLVKGLAGTFAAASTLEMPASWPHGDIPIVPRTNAGESAESEAERKEDTGVASPHNQLASVPTKSLLPSEYWISITAMTPAGVGPGSGRFCAMIAKEFEAALRLSVENC